MYKLHAKPKSISTLLMSFWSGGGKSMHTPTVKVNAVQSPVRLSPVHRRASPVAAGF